MEAWPFFISSHRVQGFTVIVAPDFMCQDGSAKLLASYAGGEPGTTKHQEIPQIKGKTEGILTLTYRVVLAEGSIVGESVPVLKDAGGRSIPIIEGVVTKGKDKNITLTEDDYAVIREACQPAFKTLWQSSDIVPTQPSSPITISIPSFSESDTKNLVSDFFNKIITLNSMSILLIISLIFIVIIFLIFFIGK